MKLHKNIQIIATYKGFVPVKNEWGEKKYVGYNYLFEEVISGSLVYSRSRAKTFDYDVKIGDKVVIVCNWRSSIITKITDVHICLDEKYCKKANTIKKNKKNNELRFYFGKYKDEYVNYIIEKDFEYIKWVLKSWKNKKELFYTKLCEVAGCS